ncbi:unnamed protein product [Tetraodon nigroviridis]|uniref:(spotted green pufferfish) hypothetical protein n=1 Tax=Tetraodon nigroviridis TaxID=99883 RepID=Q4SVE3_TETNG|nr:unnamed protein product [Tetraodon nigroviridis]
MSNSPRREDVKVSGRKFTATEKKWRIKDELVTAVNKAEKQAACLLRHQTSMNYTKTNRRREMLTLGIMALTTGRDLMAKESQGRQGPIFSAGHDRLCAHLGDRISVNFQPRYLRDRCAVSERKNKLSDENCRWAPGNYSMTIQLSIITQLIHNKGKILPQKHFFL